MPAPHRAPGLRRRHVCAVAGAPPNLLCVPPRKRLRAPPLRPDTAVVGFHVQHGVVLPQGGRGITGLSGLDSLVPGARGEGETKEELATKRSLGTLGDKVLRGKKVFLRNNLNIVLEDG
ncbi:hypothetical protein ZWY2020_007696 [Hordeum vulgare]|nr:hypothetical protein ZWY2020_007696 [Hordeum vulgare]